MKNNQNSQTRRDIPRARKCATVIGMQPVRPEEARPSRDELPATKPEVRAVRISEIRTRTLTDITVPPPSDRSGYVPPSASPGRYCVTSGVADEVVLVSSGRRRPSL